MDENKYMFPAIKGIQAGTEYFVSMVPLYVVPKLFTFSGSDLPAELRAQRIINKSRIPEIKNYILQNPDSYVFSALTVSIDGPIEFIPVNETQNNSLGTLSISMSARLLLNDGQHRKAAIEAALQEKPALRFETISIVFYHDLGLKKSQQMFSDLNRFAIRPTQSLNILYDDRNRDSLLVKKVVSFIPDFDKLIDKEHTSIPNRSIALFTLSAIFHGTNALLKDVADEKKYLEIATDFWREVYNNMSEWQKVAEGSIKASIIRKESMSPLSITIRALGHVGNELIDAYPDTWPSKLKILKDIDWNKKNPIWNKGIVVNGSVQLSHATQALMIEVLRERLLKV